MRGNKTFLVTLLIPAAVLILGLALTYALQNAAREAAFKAAYEDFDRRVGEFSEYMDRRINAYGQVLEGAVGLFAASKDVRRKEFAAYVDVLKLEGKYPGIQGVGFSIAVAPADKARHVAQVRAEGFPSYGIRPEGARDFYTSIIYLEPFDWRNQRAFGFDMYSEPVRREAMALARDRDTAAISGKVTLVQETERDIQPGFLMYVPVYRKNMPHRTAAERRANLVGWVYAPFRMKDFVHGLLSRWAPEMPTLMDLEIYDGDTTDKSALLFDSGSPESVPGPKFVVSRPLTLFDHRWTLVAHSLPAFDARLRYEEANVIAVSGAGGSVLLAMVIWLLATGRARAETLAGEMTAELRRSEAGQRKLNRALRLLSDCNTALVRAEDEYALLHEVCRLCVEHGGYPMAWVGYAEQDEAKTVRPVANFGEKSGYLDEARVAWADTDLGRGPTGTAIRTGITSINANSAENPRMAPWRDAAMQRGYLASIGLPLIVDRRVLGALTLYAAETAAFDLEEVRLLEELAGDLAYGIGALRTRTEHLLAEQEIRRLNEDLERRVADRTAQLEAANKELEAFAYSVSHDLRAPLRHIDGFVGLLAQDTQAILDEKDRHYMEIIVKAVRRMNALIEDLLAFSRMSRSEMTQSVVDLDTLVKEVLEELEPERRDRPIEWRIGPLPAVHGDRAMLKVVLVNLISNAIKFTRGRKPARIEIDAVPGGGAEHVVFVRDNGAGFDMRFADKLFGVFQRLHAADEFEGTGIGLANVRRVIARHGGRTWAEGAVDGGATFYFSLPKSVPAG